MYVADDRAIAEPVLQAFERRTGVHVDAVYAVDAGTRWGRSDRRVEPEDLAGVDVFWSDNPVRAPLLKTRGALASYKSPSSRDIPAGFQDTEGYWAGFAAAIRVIAYNIRLLRAAEAPQSVFDLADPAWKGQIAIADPRSGSSGFHAAALYAALGDHAADDLFRRLKQNGVRIVEDELAVRELIARGEVRAGLVDAVQVLTAIDRGLPIAMILPDRKGLGVPMMPGTVSIVAAAPQPAEARRLVDYLLSPETEGALAKSDAAVRIPLHASVVPPRNMPRIGTFTPMALDYGLAASILGGKVARLESILGLAQGEKSGQRSDGMTTVPGQVEFPSPIAAKSLTARGQRW